MKKGLPLIANYEFIVVSNHGFWVYADKPLHPFMQIEFPVRNDVHGCCLTFQKYERVLEYMNELCYDKNFAVLAYRRNFKNILPIEHLFYFNKTANIIFDDTLFRIISSKQDRFLNLSGDEEAYNTIKSKYLKLKAQPNWQVALGTQNKSYRKC